MKYPIKNSRHLALVPKTPSSNGADFRKQGSAKVFQPRNPVTGKTGNISQNSIEEYIALAEAAMLRGDRVLAETYYQYADYAVRLSKQANEDTHDLEENSGK